MKTMWTGFKVISGGLFAAGIVIATMFGLAKLFDRYPFMMWPFVVLGVLYILAMASYAIGCYLEEQ